jgi:hypothetical protein
VRPLRRSCRRAVLAGWSRSAGFELTLDDRAEFGLSRFSAAQGLHILKRARLVSVARRPGLSAVVTIMNVPAADD